LSRDSSLALFFRENRSFVEDGEELLLLLQVCVLKLLLDLLFARFLFLGGKVWGSSPSLARIGVFERVAGALLNISGLPPS
jgi:hypothetical protein